MTLNQRLARYFRTHRRRWIPARDLVSVGGLCAWRTRISELRDRPYGMAIESKVEVQRRQDGRIVRVSFYRFTGKSAA